MENVCTTCWLANFRVGELINVICTEQHEQEQKGEQIFLCSWWWSCAVWKENSTSCDLLSQASAHGMINITIIVTVKNVATICLNFITGHKCNNYLLNTNLNVSWTVHMLLNLVYTHLFFFWLVFSRGTTTYGFTTF